MQYTYTGVLRKRKKEWISGTFIYGSNDKHAAIDFQPSEDANRKYGARILLSDVTDVLTAKGTDGQGALVKVSYNEDGMAKNIVFHFKQSSEEACKKIAVMLRGTPTPATPIASSPAPIDDHQHDYFKEYPDKPFEYLHEDSVSEREREVRNQLLDTDPALRSVYEATVVTGIRSASDFWNTRQDIIKESVVSSFQIQGMETNNTSDLRNTGKNNEHTYQFTSEKVNRIFIEYPKVHRLFNENVPHKMDGNKFWLLYIHSKNYLPNFMHKTPNELAAYFETTQVQEACALFGSYFEDTLEESHAYDRIRLTSLESKASRATGLEVDPQIDILANLNDSTFGGTSSELAAVGMPYRYGFGIAQREPLEVKKRDSIVRNLRSQGRKATADSYQKLQAKPVESAPLISSYNRHADIILYDERNHHQRKVERIKRSIENEKEAEVLVELNEAGGIRSHPSVIELGVTENSTLPPRVEEQKLTLKREKSTDFSICSIGNVWPSKQVALQVMGQIMNVDNVGNTLGSLDLDKLPDSKELLKLFDASNELRSSFYRCFPPLNKAHIIQVLQDIVDTLKKLENRTRSFREYVRQSGNKMVADLLLDISEQIDKAIKDWEKWQNMQNNKKRKTR